MSLERPTPRENKLENNPSKKNNFTEKSLEEKFIVSQEKPKRTPEEDEVIKQLEEDLKSSTNKHTSNEHFEQKSNDDVVKLTELYNQGVQKKEKIKRIATNVTDFVPVIGSAKMILEGIKGEQMGTNKKIESWSRIIHGTSGVVFLVLDLTGIGAIGSELGKIGVKVALRSIEKETLKKVVGNKIIQKEALKLSVLGEKRIKAKEELVV